MFVLDLFWIKTYQSIDFDPKIVAAWERAHRSAKAFPAWKHAG